MALLSSVQVLRFHYYQPIVSQEAKCVLSVADPRENSLMEMCKVMAFYLAFHQT